MCSLIELMIYKCLLIKLMIYTCLLIKLMILLHDFEQDKISDQLLVSATIGPQILAVGILIDGYLVVPTWLETTVLFGYILGA